LANVTPIVPASDYAKLVKQSEREKLEELFARHCEMFHLPECERKYRFAKSVGRQWEFDFAWIQHRVAVEVEGLVVRKLFDKSGGAHTVCMGRHASITGFREDCEKYANAALLGWRVLRFERDQIKSKLAVDLTQRLLNAFPPAAPIALTSMPKAQPSLIADADPF
jgi:hypothetical protein